MAQIIIPFGPIVNDSGVLVAGATVTIASVKSPLDDSNIASHGATVNVSSDGLRVGVLYDVAAKGEAWITLAVSKAGSTITGLNASPVAFAAADAQTIASRASQASVDALPASIGALVSVYAVMGLRSRIGETETDYITLIKSDDRSVAILFQDGSGNPANIPTVGSAALLDSSGASVGTVTVSSTNAATGYILLRLQAPSSGNLPTTLRITFSGGSGAAYKHDIPVRSFS